MRHATFLLSIVMLGAVFAGFMGTHKRLDDIAARLDGLAKAPANYSIEINHNHPTPQMMKLRATGYTAKPGKLTKSGEDPVPFWTLAVSPDLWPTLQGKLLFLPHIGIMGRVTDQTARWLQGTVDINVNTKREEYMVTADAVDVLVLPDAYGVRHAAN